MKKIFLLIIISHVGACSNGQTVNFENFSSYFKIGQLPFMIDNFNIPKGKIVPSDLALSYICKGDSSLLTFDNIGINQDTRKIVYKKKLSYQYKAYVKYNLGSYHIFIYDGYVKDGNHEYTNIINIGLYNQQGNFLDLMPFYIFDDTGKLTEQTGLIQSDFKILVKRKEYLKNEKGINTRFYKEITDTYEIEKASGKFIKTQENTTIIQ